MATTRWMRDLGNNARQILYQEYSQISKEETGKEGTNPPNRKNYRKVNEKRALARDKHLARVRENILEYQQLIKIQCWAVEISRVDTLHQLSLLSSHIALSQEEHIDAAYGIFTHLTKHEESMMSYNDKIPEIYLSSFESTDWGKSIYRTSNKS